MKPAVFFCGPRLRRGVGILVALAAAGMLAGCQAPAAAAPAVDTGSIASGLHRASVSATQAAHGLAVTGTALSRVDGKANVILEWLKENP